MTTANGLDANGLSSSSLRFSTGATTKDTKTKSRGRVEVGEGVGLAEVGWRDEEKMQTIVTE